MGMCLETQPIQSGHSRFNPKKPAKPDVTWSFMGVDPINCHFLTYVKNGVIYTEVNQDILRFHGLKAYQSCL